MVTHGRGGVVLGVGVFVLGTSEVAVDEWRWRWTGLGWRCGVVRRGSGLGWRCVEEGERCGVAVDEWTSGGGGGGELFGVGLGWSGGRFGVAVDDGMLRRGSGLGWRWTMGYVEGGE